MTSTPTEARRLDVQTLQERLSSEDAPRVLDVRTPAEFETAHIPGAYNVPLDNLREHRGELRRHLDEDVVLVCRSGQRAEQAEKALAEVGLPGLRVLEGGMVAWESAGAPVNRGRQTWELERQVRLVAGSIVLSSILGSVATPRLKWLAAGVGTGLVGAALTNTCAMGTMLSKMPWNKRGDSCDMDQIVKALNGTA
ncbi:MAG TPA: rhodanese-like domain-containing protein [Nocardioidaceae bacterium]|jgi:rhodanese-related sulfurtransferase|nr:rhodanese-like domain-containing protein [Nocardioidaceae bacterium]